MERLFGLLLLGALLETGAFATEAQFDNLGYLWHVLAALRDDALHVAAFGADQATGHLELALVWNLDVVAASILGRGVGVAIATDLVVSEGSLGLLRILLLHLLGLPERE